MALDCPKDIQFESMIVDVSCHPHRDVIAAGQIDGPVTVYSYSTTEDNHLLLNLPHHKKSCRALRFSPSGDRLVTVSKDKSIQVVDMNSGSVIKKLKKAHESSLYSLLVVDENMLATGDDDGFFKVWDLRQNKTVMEVKEHDEFISDMVIDDNNRVLVATSGDGTLSAFDIRKHKLKLQSELFDSELLSVAKVKNGDKVVCGTGEGVLNLFNWGEWGNLSDRLPGHPMSVDCIVPVTQDIVLTGSMDGIIRAVHILPNRFIGVVGEHTGFPIENMTKSRCGNFLASCSHDQIVKFWNINDVGKQKVSTKRKAKKSLKNKPLTKAAKKSDFFSDLAAGEGTSNKDDEDSESEESESDSETESDKNKSETVQSTDTTLEPNNKNVDVKQDNMKDDNDDSDFISDDDDDDDEISDSNFDESDILNESNISSTILSSSSSSEDDSEESVTRGDGGEKN